MTEGSYASDFTNEECLLIGPFMPAASKVGRPRKWPMREIWNAIQYITAMGPVGDVAQRVCAVHDNPALVLPVVRQRHVLPHQRDAGHVRAASGRSRGYDVGKKVKGRKRHILMHTQMVRHMPMADTAGGLLA